MAKKRKAQQQDNDDEETTSSEEEEETEESSSQEEQDSSSSGDSSSSSEEEEEEEGEEEGEGEGEEENSKNDDVSSKPEKVRKLLEPFSKDQIIAFLKEEALKDPSILSRILHKADSDPTHRKIFVHGLGWDATDEQVLQVFKPFGEIEEFKLITDKVTGRAKGYAFVLFTTRAAAKKALKIPHKKIGNRIASCQLAALGPAAGAAAAGQPAEVSKRKLFVANVGPNVNVERLRTLFGKFGEIEDGPLGLDPSTNKPRGFAIFVYKSVDGLKKALEEPVKLFEGCQLNCKMFVEGLNSSSNKNSSNPQQNQSNVSYGFGANSGVLGSNLNAGGMLMQQNPGIGLVGNPILAAALNPSGLAAAMAGMGGNYGMNSLSPSVIGNYGPQAMLQGLGVYQSAQMRQSSVGANAAGVAVGSGSAQAQSGVGSSGMALPSNFSH